MKKQFFGVLLALGFSVSACQFFGTNTVDQTLVAQNQALSTEIAAIRLTATVEADRAMITQEFISTALSHVNGQTNNLQATLIATGAVAGSIDFSQITPQAPVVPDGQFQVTQAPLVLDLGNPGRVTPISITPGAPDTSMNNPPPAVDPAGQFLQDPNQQTVNTDSRLSNIVTTSAVASNDCAMNTSTTFNTSTREIYVVANANNVGPQDTVTSRWFLNGQEMIAHNWSPQFVIEGACIWFYIDQFEVTFTPGNWQVQLELNNTPIGLPVPFSIVDGANQGDLQLNQQLGGGS